MEKTFRLEIYASDHEFFVGDACSLVFPAIDGEFGVMPDHEPTITALVDGELRFTLPDGTTRYAAVSEGFVEIINNKVLILADTVERPEDIDAKRAEYAKMMSEEKLRQHQSIMEYYQTQTALRRAVTRLKVAQRHDNKYNQ